MTLVLASLLVLGALLSGASVGLRGVLRWSRRPAPSSPSPMIKRLFAIAFIFVCCSVAWMVLGGTVVHRTDLSEASTRSEVGGLWGGPQVQHQPTLVRLGEHVAPPPAPRPGPAAPPEASGGLAEGVPVGTAIAPAQPPPAPRRATTRTAVPLDGSDLKADLRLSHRKKGLMWYATYAADFDGTYSVANDGPAGDFEFVFPLPSGSSLFSDLALSVDGTAAEVDVDGGEIRHTLALGAGEAARVRVRYGSQGVSTWRYSFGPDVAAIEPAVDEYGYREPVLPPPSSVRTARDVKLVLTTDFADIDFPPGTLSPSAKKRTDDGWTLTWDTGTLVASAGFGIAMPQRLNPGPWVSRVTFFAPVSLFLFFFAVFVLSILRGVRLHPMHYFFLGAACFAFHLLLAYLVDVVPVGVAMAVASVTSVGLVVSYVRLVAGTRFALVEVGGAQVVYLVAFAATFFLEGVTGLAVTLLSVATLFVVMQATGRLDWEAVLARPESAGPNGSARRERPAVAV